MKRVAVTAAIVAVAVAAAAAVVLTRDDGRTPDERQAVLDRLVTGAGRVAPGVTAYVAGPNGTWSGAAGLANVDEDEPMRPDARLRLESVSKLWTAVVVLRLAADGRLSLEDTVERWLPGTFPDGDRMTVRQLLNHTSGLVNNDDVGADPQRMLALVRDAGLRGRVEAALRRVEAQPNWEFPAPLVVELAAALPLVAEPGTAFRYSNIGYHVAGLIAERAAGRPFGELVDATIVRPLGLASARYDPHSAITGPHARGYLVGEGGALTDVTGQVFDLGANGGIVSNARDEARFLVALMSGDLLPARELAELKRPAKERYALGTGVFSSCAGTAYTHDGGGAGYATSAIVSGDGRHVAVVLANGRTGDDGRAANSAVSAAAITLFCGP